MNNTQTIYIYNGVDEVPEDVSHVRVDPSVAIIPRYAFQCRRNLEEVELPEGLIRIGDYAFHRCISLKKITIPSTVEDIGESSFDHCEKLEGIVLPEGLQRLGKWAFSNCRSLQRINIPPNVETIEQAVFLWCHSLSSVTFSEGLHEIGLEAFSRCNSLVSVNLPSTLKVIGEEAFEGCTRLNEVYMPDSIEIIRARAFKNCNVTQFRTPPLTVLDFSIFEDNTCLVSLELAETVEQFKDSYAHFGPGHSNVLGALRNIAFPLECEVCSDILGNCTDLEGAFPDVGYDTMLSALKHRFDDLPIHKICYYQSYFDSELTLQSLKREINPWTTKPPGQLNTSGKEQDCVGMTPLHILACSTKPTIAMYRFLIDKYPETLIMKDKSGDIPLLYALWCNAPTDIVDLLVESYKSFHPEYEFEWKGMLLTLAKRDVPLFNIQKLMNKQYHISPDYNYNMQGIVLELAISDTEWAFQNGKYTHPETFKYLLRVSIRKRLDSLAVQSWHVELDGIIDGMSKVANRRDSDTEAVYNKLATYESMKEGTSVLELALWKAKIDESRNKKARVDGEVSYRDQCRVNNGADIVIRNVLPYLLPFLSVAQMKEVRS